MCISISLLVVTMYLVHSFILSVPYELNYIIIYLYVYIYIYLPLWRNRLLNYFHLALSAPRPCTIEGKSWHLWMIHLQGYLVITINHHNTHSNFGQLVSYLVVFTSLLLLLHTCYCSQYIILLQLWMLVGYFTLLLWLVN